MAPMKNMVAKTPNLGTVRLPNIQKFTSSMFFMSMTVTNTVITMMKMVFARMVFRLNVETKVLKIFLDISLLHKLTFFNFFF